MPRPPEFPCDVFLSHSSKDRAVVLRAMLESFISRAWCLRQPCDGSALLTFPSYFRLERKEQPSHPSVLVTYRFDGPADDIYATLEVRLHSTVAFHLPAQGCPRQRATLGSCPMRPQP